MSKKLFDTYGIKQLGYYVESIEDAAELFFGLLGAGPFIDLGVNVPDTCKVRGMEEPVEMRTAIGYLGDMEIELIEVLSDCPSPFQEIGRYGLNHYSIWVDDVEAAKADFKEHGFEIAMELTSGAGLHVVYFDMRKTLGQYIEVNQPNDRLAQMGKGVHQKLDGPALIGIQDVMKMIAGRD